MSGPLTPPAAPVDGRQSQAALDLQRGVGRVLLRHDFACLAEVTVRSGRRADVMALGPDGAIWIVEIKSSVADFQSDRKWPEYREWCDRLLFAVAPGFPLDLIPEDTGLIVADRFGGDIVREAPVHALSGARRKALTLRFARIAARRMQALVDPELVKALLD